MEQAHRGALQATMDTRDKFCKPMAEFFREKRGEHAATSPSHCLNSVEDAERGMDWMDKDECPGNSTRPRSTCADDVLVLVVDTDGRYIGAVERIQPWNQWVEAIQDLPIQRPVMIRRGCREHLSGIYGRVEAKGVKWLYCMIQATGEVQRKRC